MEDKEKDNEKNKESEAGIDDNSVLVDKALKSFCCYLYVGKGHPYYKARPWNDDESYSMRERLQTVDILAANEKTELVPIDKIRLAMESKLIRRPEHLMFALAMCARQKKSEKLCAAAYCFLAEDCKEWKYFILFIKYASILCKMDGSTENEKTGHIKGSIRKEGTKKIVESNDQIEDSTEKKETGHKEGTTGKKKTGRKKTGNKKTGKVEESIQKVGTEKIVEPTEKVDTGQIDECTEKEGTGHVKLSTGKEETGDIEESIQKEGTEDSVESTDQKDTNQIGEFTDQKDTDQIEDSIEKEGTEKIVESTDEKDTDQIKDSTENEATGQIDGVTEKDERSHHIGWGHGWKNAVNKWYLTQDAECLCKLVTVNKGNYGWKHKDILKLSHPNTKKLEVKKQAIMCYVIRGLKQAEKEYNSDPEAKVILETIRSIESCKRCENPKEVANLISDLSLTIDYVHPKLLKNRKVWNALLVKMDVRTILKNLRKLNDLGYLTMKSTATKLVAKSLTSRINLRQNKILPGDILEILNRYEQGQTLALPFRKELEIGLTRESRAILEIRKKAVKEAKKKKAASDIEARRRSKKRTVVSPDIVPNAKTKTKTNRSRRNAKSKISEQPAKCPAKPKVHVPDPRFRDTLRIALGIAQTVDITKSRKKRYLVSVNLPGCQSKSICAEVGLAIALPLLRRKNLPDSAVTIIGFVPRLRCYSNDIHAENIFLPCVSPAKITRDMSFDKALKLLFDKKTRYSDYLITLDGPLEWAFSEKKKYDVFINVTNEPPHKKILKLMGTYRELMNLPDARLINVIINKAPFQSKGDEWHDSLTIDGNDPHVPWIIEAYVRGLF